MSDAWSFSQAFSSQFQTARTELEWRVEATRSTNAAVSGDALQNISVDLARLTKTLADATGSLPSYDQRQYELQLKALEQKLEELRTRVPKSKFAFKRKAPAPIPPSAPLVALAAAPETSSQSFAPTSTNLTLASHSRQYLSMTALPPAAQASDLTISDLKSCIVNLLPDAQGAPTDGSTYPEISALHIRNVTDTVLLLPVIRGSVLLHDLRRCIVVVGCHQFRMHTSKRVDVYLSIPSTPIIEHCAQIRFAPYPATLYKDASPSNNNFAVQDFSHIKSTPSPHWSMMANDTAVVEWPTSGIASRRGVAELLDPLLMGLPAETD
ncbi:tubulin binding cofactor C-domain-containing protein [Mycena sp. CBHHK59/15]|nr:tubulin binding cofactor C-domain-containing protein [Mycena sp. CBHHK59/15]